MPLFLNTQGKTFVAVTVVFVVAVVVLYNKRICRAPEINVTMHCLESELFVAYACFVSILNCIRYQCLTLIIYHVVVNIITIVHIS